MEFVPWCFLFLSFVHASDSTHCDPPPSNSFTKVVRKYSDGDKVQYKCITGYERRTGSLSTRCVNGQWTPPYTLECQRVVFCLELNILHGVYMKKKRAGLVIDIACQKPFQLKGAARVTCSPEGKWIGEIPTCSLGCGEPDDVSNFHLMDRYRSRTSFPEGARVRYRCDLGFARTGGNAYRTCKEGRWTDLAMICERKLCGFAGEVLNGYTHYNGARFGDSATVLCYEGYQLVGQNVRWCRDGGWDGRNPVCEAVQCPEPPEGGSVMRSDAMEGPYEYSRVIRYECRVGKLLGPASIYCTKDGTWSAAPPECTDIQCPYPSFSNAQRIAPSRDRYDFGDTVPFRCHRGDARTRSHMSEIIVTCGLDGTWTPPRPCR